ncbi:cation-transporting ATPase [Microbacterium sp. CIAB417]|uniref:cation-transporting ATPase n=1 Tax=Microbacterium sp. CIAB417 TaxID=2860287 RepID=UPI001FAB4E48|nr:cation-transporting ATPase [Microbacterium sp. CIAB417]
MDKISRLIGMASKALDKNSASRGSGSSGSTDWGGVLRGAVDAVRGPAQPTTSPSPHVSPASTPAPAGSGANPYAPPPAPGAGVPRSATGTGSAHPYAPPPAPRAAGAPAVSEADRAAIARYDYLMQTADPHRIEQIHRDAFARLTPQQRAHVEQRMRSEFAPGERPASSSPDDLARAAGRAEALRPGSMRGLLSRVGGAGVGGAAVVAGGAALGVLGAVAAGSVLSAAAGPLLEQATAMGVDFVGLAEGVDVESLAGGADELLGSAGETVSGLGDSVSEWGSALGDFGLGGLFGR